MCDDGLAPSVALVHALIDAQIASGVPAERVLVGGFSQGSTVHTHPLALRGLSACYASPPQGAVARARLPALGRLDHCQLLPHAPHCLGGCSGAAAASKAAEATGSDPSGSAMQAGRRSRRVGRRGVHAQAGRRRAVVWLRGPEP